MAGDGGGLLAGRARVSGVLFIGASHLLQMTAAVGRVTGDWQEASEKIVDVVTPDGPDHRLLFVTSRPTFMELSGDAEGGVSATFGPLMDEVRAYNRPDATVVLGIGGNEHNIRFLRAHPRPFDFHLPACPVIDPARQIVPLEEMRSVVRGLAARTLDVTRLIAAEIPLARRYCVAPPPPIPDEAQIRKAPEIFDFARTGVENPHVRLKIYMLYVELLSALCDAHGIAFFGPAHQDAAGFLLPSYWAGCTHATSDYYAEIIAEIGL